jgi:hypothetical protein
MKEPGFNLFVFVEKDYVRELGAAVREVDGSDEEKLEQLQSTAVTDAANASRFRIPPQFMARQEDGSFEAGIEYRMFQRMTNGGRLCEVFEEVLSELGAGPAPMICLTPVVDGTVRIDRVGRLPEAPIKLDRVRISRFAAPDYARVYLTDGGFDLARLLNDDYFRAIKLLFNERLYVSAAKLLMSFVDTVSYLHEGDKPGNFQRWLSAFVDLPSLGITSDEVWELRNSLLHMTNVDSRKVVAGKVRRLLFFVGTMPCGFGPSDREVGYFNLYALIFALTEGLEKWAHCLNKQPSQMPELFERYDRVLSDVRYEVISHSPIEQPRDAADER